MRENTGKVIHGENYQPVDMAKAAKNTLTDREYSVLCYRRGFDNNIIKPYRQIAQLLKISPRTVHETEKRADSKLKKYLHYHSLVQDYRDGKLAGESFPTRYLDIPVNVRNILDSKGFTTAGDIAKLKSAELRRIRTIGGTALGSIKDELSHFGLRLED